MTLLLCPSIYVSQDLVRAQNDGILIDNCASGGQRIDLETLSRSAPLWRTDYDAVGGCCSFAWKHTCIGVCPECSGPFGCGVMDNSAAQSMSMGLSVLTPIHSGPVPSWDEYYWRSTGVIGKTICKSKYCPSPSAVSCGVTQAGSESCLRFSATPQLCVT